MLYTYTAIDKKGVSLSGERDAGSPKELSEKLKSEGLLMLDAKEKAAVSPFRFSIRGVLGRYRRISLVDRMMFARNLAVMIGAGLALAKALSAMEEQIDNEKFREVIGGIKKTIVEGKTFAEGLQEHEAVFGTLFVNMVAAGEVSGKLRYVLNILARQMKRDHDLVSKVRGALIYPAIIVGALFIIGFLMMIYVVPTLTQTFQELGIALPPTTKVVIGTSQFILHYYFYIIGAIPVVGFAAWRLLRTGTGKAWWGRLSIRIPIFGPLVKKLNSARFARILSSLISSGLPIIKALTITANVVGNSQFRATLGYAAEEIQKGRSLATILKSRPDLFPPLVTQMLEVGEETGTTSRMLLRLAIFYESEVSNTTKNLSGIIEPVLMVVIGGLVGFFAVSMIQPIYSGLGGLQ